MVSGIGSHSATDVKDKGGLELGRRPQRDMAIQLARRHAVGSLAFLVLVLRYEELPLHWKCSTFRLRSVVRHKEIYSLIFSLLSQFTSISGLRARFIAAKTFKRIIPLVVPLTGILLI